MYGADEHDRVEFTAGRGDTTHDHDPGDFPVRFDAVEHRRTDGAGHFPAGPIRGVRPTVDAAHLAGHAIVRPVAPIPSPPSWKSSLRRRVFATPPVAPPTGNRQITGRAAVGEPVTAATDVAVVARRYVAESDPQHGVATVHTDGTFDYTPGMAARRLSRTAGPVADRFRVSVSDDRGRCSTLSINPIVTADGAPTPVVFSTNTVGSESIDVAGAPRAMVLDAEGARLYVAASETSTVTVVDTATATVVATIAMPGEPTALCLDPNGGRLFVALTAAHTIAAVDLATATVMGGITVASPVGVAMSSDGAHLLVVTADGSLRVLDASGHAVATLTGLGAPRRMVLSTDDARLYVLDESGVDAVVHVIAAPTTAPREVGSIRADGFVHDMALGRSDSRLHLVSASTRTLITADTRTLMVTSVIDLGSFHTGVAAAPDGFTVHVANSFNGSVSAIDLRTARVVAQAPTGEFPRQLICSRDGSRVYAATAGAISVLSRSVRGAIVGPDDGIGRIYALAGGPRRGSVDIDVDGGFTYTADLPYIDTDEFRVLVDDGLRTAGTAVISVTGTPAMPV